LGAIGGNGSFSCDLAGSGSDSSESDDDYVQRTKVKKTGEAPAEDESFILED
jgi:hypothetical protein